MTTKTWTGAVSNDWNDPGNWSPSGVPGSGDDVVIGTTANSPDLGVGTSTTVNAITINGTDTLSLERADVLTVTNGVTLSSTGGISGQGTLTAPSAFATAVKATGAAQITATGGTLDIEGTVTDSGGGALVLSIASSAILKLGGVVADTAHSVNFGASATLELMGRLTVGTAMNLGSGTLLLDVSPVPAFSDVAGITLSTGAISGGGRIEAAVTATGAGNISASGVGLSITGPVFDNGGALTLHAFGGNLDLGAASAAQTVDLSHGSIRFSDALTVANAIMVGAGSALRPGGPNALLIDSNGVVLSGGSAALHIAGGSILGIGVIAAGVSGDVTGIIEADNGTLRLTEPVASGPTFAIADDPGSVLRFENDAVAAAPIVIDTRNKTLAIATVGAQLAKLTINGGVESITNGTIVLSGGLLTDSAGFNIGSGAALIGYGTVVGPINGTGLVEANTARLELATALPISNATVFEIANTADAALQFDVSPGTGHTFTFLGPRGNLSLNDDSGFDNTISGLNVGQIKTNFVDILGHAVTIAGVTGQGTTSGTITLSDGAVLHLTNLNATNWAPKTVSDGAGGTDIYLGFPGAFPVHDFNRDGFADIPLQRAGTGQTWLWEMNGTTMIGGGNITTPDPGWQVKGVGDLNADGKADLVLQRSNTGQVYAWEMSGNSIIGGGSVGTPDPGWQVKTTGDVDGNGTADIILQNSNTGQVYLWEMSGRKITLGASLGTPDPGWQVITTGDFTGDRKADIVLQNSNSGQVGVWEMNGAAVIKFDSIATPDPGWRVKTAADFSGHGGTDILLQNANTGQVYLWGMTGTQITGGGSVGTPNPGWQVPVA